MEFSSGALPKLGRGRTVPLGEADRELRRAWVAIDEDSRSSHGESMLRLREVNLVAVSTEARLERTRAVAALTVREHPGRVIVIAPGGAGSSASIATGCLVDRFSGRRVCSEEVVIEMARGDEEQLRAAVLQLLVPGVPVVGWWAGDPSVSGSELARLAEVADRLVTDLAGTEDLAAALTVLLDAADARSDLGLRDLEWLRCEPWRELVAEFFERPDRRLLIPHIERLEVVHHGAPVQALLLAAWFVSRLGGLDGNATMKLLDDGATSLTLRVSEIEQSPSHLEVLLREDSETTIPAGHLVEADIRFGVDLGRESGGSTSTGDCVGRVVSVSRLPHSLVCRCGTEGVGGGTVVKATGIAVDTDDRLLSAVIDTPARELGFREVVRTALLLARAPGLTQETRGHSIEPAEKVGGS